MCRSCRQFLCPSPPCSTSPAVNPSAKDPDSHLIPIFASHCNRTAPVLGHDKIHTTNLLYHNLVRRQASSSRNFSRQPTNVLTRPKPNWGTVGATSVPFAAMPNLSNGIGALSVHLNERNQFETAVEGGGRRREEGHPELVGLGFLARAAFPSKASLVCFSLLLPPSLPPSLPSRPSPLPWQTGEKPPSYSASVVVVVPGATTTAASCKVADEVRCLRATPVAFPPFSTPRGLCREFATRVDSRRTAPPPAHNGDVT